MYSTHACRYFDRFCSTLLIEIMQLLYLLMTPSMINAKYLLMKGIIALEASAETLDLEFKCHEE